ncbi:hypothetical protein CLV84_1855 [Neolewinella xylanilytica]|uniref:DUF6438 domain-containing protein n=1 Tax=Neolewinella xylanilytica TaxID=1514080 RepID=A0A2S6IBJ4_9BACT|nr:DUF6438 domain-containing protein [Neolewinella xylanilytica]PPK88881.1 hypothetical protein CLV84_1855 [Neolewinella xylanilytica]
MNNYYTALLGILLLCLSCTRQPIGISGSPNTPVQAPIEDGNVSPDPEIDEARALRTEEELSRGVEAPARPGVGNLPDESEVKAMRREEVRRRREAMESPQIETNETAEIENQASLGQAPIAELGYREEVAEDANAPELIFQKSTCYGDCEAYTFSLQSGGMTSLLVDKGEVAQGLYNRQLYSVDYEDLNNSIDSLRQLTFDPVYPVEAEVPTDIPYRLLTIPDQNGYPRNIKIYSNAPPALERFMNRLEVLIGEQSWQTTEKNDGGKP